MTPAVRFYVAHLLPAVAVALMLVLLERTHIDTKLSNWYFDAATREFPLRHNAFLDVVMHHWAKYLVALVAVAALAGYAITFIVPRLKTLRPLFLFVALGMMLAPLTVAILKFLSVRHCPWSLELYGGFAPHITLFDSFAGNVAPGRCFPAGHASTGFCLFAFYFLGRALGSRVLAQAGLALGLIAGIGLGWVRIAQGAHFLTHVLWSGVVCWIVITILYARIVGPNAPAYPVRLS